MNKVFSHSLIATLLLAVACTPAKNITYGTKDIKSRSDSVYIDKSLSLAFFEDVRDSDDINDTEILFSNNRIYKINGSKFCINSEKNYKSPKIPEQIATVLTDHFHETKIFKKVYTNNESVNFQLTGEIKRLYGIQEFSNAAAAGANFGLIGALATAGIKTEGTIRITLTNLTLTDTETNVEFPLDDIDLQFEGEYKVDGACWSIFDHVNEKLKTAVDTRLVPSVIEVLKTI